MSDPEEDGLQTVLEGREPDGTFWSILAQPDPSEPQSMYTFIQRVRPGGHKARSGMGGPKLHGDDVVNVWAGKSDGTPPFILLRGLPSIEEAAVVTQAGAIIPVTLSPVIETFGLRFGAAALPEDDAPETLRVRLADGRVVLGRVPWPRRPPTA
jgi:hypothetical protein